MQGIAECRERTECIGSPCGLAIGHHKPAPRVRHKGELRSGSEVTHAALKTSGLWAGYHRAQRRMHQAQKRGHDGVPVDGRAMGRRRSRGAEVEQRLITEETWYARKCRDGSVLSCPSVIVHPLPAGMALLQPRAHIAHAFGDAMQVVEAPCPRCLAMTQTAMHDRVVF
jgi:hypothetical protein